MKLESENNNMIHICTVFKPITVLSPSSTSGTEIQLICVQCGKTHQ